MPKITTKFIKQTLEGAAKKIQRSNTWTSGADLKTVTDSKGKSRNAYCARGAICAVLSDNTQKGIDKAMMTKEYAAVEKQLLKTFRKDPTTYRPDGSQVNDLVDINDTENKHSNVIKLFRDTIDRLG